MIFSNSLLLACHMKLSKIQKFKSLNKRVTKITKGAEQSGIYYYLSFHYNILYSPSSKGCQSQLFQGICVIVSCALHVHTHEKFLLFYTQLIIMGVLPPIIMQYSVQKYSVLDQCDNPVKDNRIRTCCNPWYVSEQLLHVKYNFIC